VRPGCTTAPPPSHARHWRQVADVVVDRAEEGDDGGLVGGDAVKIAHLCESFRPVFSRMDAIVTLPQTSTRRVSARIKQAE